MSKFSNDYNFLTNYGEIKYTKVNGINYIVSHTIIDIESNGDHIVIDIKPDDAQKFNVKSNNVSKTNDTKLDVIKDIFSKLTNYFSF
jgi:hypothetical protein